MKIKNDHQYKIIVKGFNKNNKKIVEHSIVGAATDPSVSSNGGFNFYKGVIDYCLEIFRDENKIKNISKLEIIKTRENYDDLPKLRLKK